MREIKFRCWLADGECLYFDLDDLNGSFTLPNDIEQFTGLTDKNGKEIYEGDILHGMKSVQFKIPYEGEMYMAWKDEVCTEPRIVKIHEGKAAIDNPKSPSGWYYGLLNNSERTMTYNLEVVGNIHENPELLK